MVNHLSKGTFYQDSYFNEEVVESQCVAVEVDTPIEKWSDRDQHQLHHEALQWLDFKGDEIERLCFKTE